MAYDTLERRIKRFLGDKKNFSTIIFNMSHATFQESYIIDYAARVGIVPENKKKVIKALCNYDHYSVVESISKICHHILNVSIGEPRTFPAPLYIHVGSVSLTLNDHRFQKAIGEDLTLFLKLLVQECHAYILGLKFTDISKCPQCGAVFIKSENRQKYCTPACSNNYRTEKYRRRHKNEQ